MTACGLFRPAVGRRRRAEERSVIRRPELEEIPGSGPGPALGRAARALGYIEALTTSTGQSALPITRSETLPISSRPRPVRP
jgi:hypothetical protein